jgi:eukaryotic-like serine/threonine-protein kinase
MIYFRKALALGVLLYQLLTGRPPFDGKQLLKSGLEEMRRTIREDEPPRPSTRLSTLTGEEISSLAHQRGTDAPKLIHSIRGDLDWIVMKCLDKDRERRYETTNGLAADIQRYLTNEPITARPPTVTYRFRKALRRNRLAFTTSALVALSLVAGAGLSTWQAIRATRAEREQTSLREQADQSTRTAEQAQANEAKEHQASVVRLYDSLLREMQSTRQARRVGYRARVFSLLKQACALKVPQRNLTDLRSEAIACLGDFVGLSPTSLTNRVPAGLVETVRFASDSRCAAFVLEDGTIQLRQLPSGEEIARLKEDFPARSLAFVDGSDRLVSVHVPSDSTLEKRILGARVCYWIRDPVGRWHQESKLSVPGAFLCLGSTENPFVAVADRASNSLLLLSANAGTLAQRFKVPENFDRFPQICLSSDERFLVVEETRLLAPNITAVHVWDLSTGRQVGRLESRLSWLRGLNFSPDGKYLGILCAGGGVIYSTDQFRRQGIFRDYFQYAAEIAFQPRSTIVALPLIQQNRIRLWNWASGQDNVGLDESEPAYLTAFTPDRGHLLTVGLRNMQIYPLDLGNERLDLRGHMSGVPTTGFSPDGLRIASVCKDRSVQVRQVATDEVIWESNDLPGPGQSLAYSPNGRYLATTDYDTDLVVIWDAATGLRLLTLGDGHRQRIWSVRFSPDGGFLITASTSGDGCGIRIWSLDRSKLEARLEKRLLGVTQSLEISPDGRRVAYRAEDVDLYIWDFQTETPPRRMRANLFTGVQSESFSPDGRHLFALGSNRELVTFDVATGDTVSSIPTRNSGSAPWSAREANLCLSPDGTKLAIASESNRSVDIWDPAAGKLLYSLPAESGTIWWLAWSPDSRRLSVSRADGDIAVWSFEEIEKVLATLGLSPSGIGAPEESVAAESLEATPSSPPSSKPDAANALSSLQTSLLFQSFLYRDSGAVSLEARQNLAHAIASLAPARQPRPPRSRSQRIDLEVFRSGGGSGDGVARAGL